jgi:hypothetical protein
MPPASTVSRAALLGVLAVLAGAAFLWAPALLRSHAVVTSAPSPGPWLSRLDIGLRPGSEACVDRVALDTATERIQVRVSSRGPSTARLAMEASAPGYRELGSVDGPTTTKPERVQARIRPPDRNRVGTVCVRNAGSSPVSLFGTNEPTAIGVSRTTVDGRSLGDEQAIELILLEGEDRSIVGRLGTIMHRASDFTGGLMPFWLAWPLVVLFVLATPFAIFAAFRLAFDDETV